MSELGPNVGSAWVSLRFSAKGSGRDIQTELDRELAGVGDQAGAKTGDDFSKSFSKNTKVGDKVGRTIGSDLSHGFERETSGIGAKLRSIFGSSSNSNGVSRSLLDISRGAETAGKSLSTLGQGASGSVSGMSALIGTGVALSPVLITLGTGLGGFAAAAYGVAKNSKLMHQYTAPLKSSFAAFTKSLQPEVLSAFGHGLTIAQGLMKDIEPVAKSTGKAFDSFLGAFGKDLQGSEWQNFFKWMGTQGATDMNLVGTGLINLANDIPPLVQALNPVGQTILRIFDDVTKGVGAAEKGISHYVNDVTHPSGGPFAAINKAFNWLDNHIPAGHKSILQLIDGGQKAASNLNGMAGAAQNAATKLVPFRGDVHSLAQKFSNLATAELSALTPLEKYANNSITAKNDLVNLVSALKQSHDKVGLNTAAQRNSFATAQTYISNLQQQAQQALKSGHNAKSAAQNIADGLPTLAKAAQSNKTLRKEVDLLRQALENLRKEHSIHTAVTVTGSGQWAYTQGQSGSRRGPTQLGTYATGGLINGPGTSTSDSILARLSKGELVVPASLVKSGAADGLRGMIPGFANGGLIGAYNGNVGGLSKWMNKDWSLTIKAITNSIAGAMAHSLSSSIAGGPSGMGVAANGPLQSYARKLLSAYGWGGMWGAFNDIVMRESGWNIHATNPSSGAYGIPQALPPGKMASAGADWRTNGYTQLRWMMSYIKSAWGNPNAADYNERRSHWYDSGGLAVGAGFMPKKTLAPERVLSPQQTKAFDKMASSLSGDGEPLKMRIVGGKVDFDPRKSEIYFRDLAVEEARSEIKFAAGH